MLSQIHNAREGSVRDLLESYLLTGQPTAAIAEKTKISPETINAYAAAFFDVADRLDQARFILQEAVFSERDEKRPGVCLKLLAYFDGVSALDEVTQRAGIGSSSKWVSLMQEDKTASSAEDELQPSVSTTYMISVPRPICSQFTPAARVAASRPINRPIG